MSAVHLAVRNVAETSRWYRRLLGVRAGPVRADLVPPLFELLQDACQRPVLVISQWEHAEVEALRNQLGAPRQTGSDAVFDVSDFEACLRRAKLLRADVRTDDGRGGARPAFTVRDPEGHRVTVRAERSPAS